MADWHLDDGVRLDAEGQASIDAELEFNITYQHNHRPFHELEVVCELDISVDFQHSVALDLLRLIPAKFHLSQLLKDYIDEVELEVGTWLTSVRDMNKLANPNIVSSRDYLKHIAALIGLDLPPEDDSTEAEVRRAIIQAVDWYKIKGTYESILILGLVQKQTVNIYDMYTNDYITFYMEEWFVGDEDENPSGYDSTYYKSPHFGIEIVLDNAYSVDTGSAGSGASGASGASGGSGSSSSAATLYLWQSSDLDNLYDSVELTRPVHTVPHYILLLSPKTDEFGHVISTEGSIYTKVLEDWEITTRYFDMHEDGDSWDLDDGVYFDASVEAFVNSIQTWVLGTGSGNINDSDFDIVSPALTGSIDTDDIVIYDDRITFSFIVPKYSVQSGITELGLYTTDSKLVVASTFPSIDKDNRVELKVVVSVYKENLST